ncbi:MAG: RHH-type transcriptional regulator, proline utilization regulon repressor / proline dehydrogenase [Thermoleophilaceae bacterium]|nr:RHH-type transcriptional regulator, proline utilization regulon repressor / proline dehydrogenase [Thermoleophilaceae bacterium]
MSFRNEPILELRRAPVREGLLEALRDLDAKLPLAVPVLIGGERGADAGLDSTDPGSPERLVARAGRAGAAEAAAAVEAAQRGFREWGGRSAAERSRALRGAAARLRERRLELAALQVRECAKPWPEADADVCEAIDFLEYYAAGAVELESGRELIQVPGERNRMRYAPRGVAAVIAPWNFPLAIPCGMTAAALAAGNAAVLKPAEQSPASAAALVDALHEGGVPRDALALLPGHGDAGAALVRDPRVHVIAFTGSSAVGLEILRDSAETPEAQGHVKRVVSEMGGKNCVIVDADADLDEAVPAIVQSAFAYAGQKCSAAARVLVHEAVSDTLVQRLAGATEVLRVGQADEFATEVPPVIEREAQERVLRYAEIAEREGRIAARATPVPESGWFCPPAIAVDLPEQSQVNREEVFGPLLSVTTVAGVEEACDIVDSLPFALTGGLFSRNPATVERVAARLPVGNLYVNRGITGAMVGRQPFGGNRRSGIGAKAGGPDYLLQFTEPRVVTENTMRQGIAIE